MNRGRAARQNRAPETRCSTKTARGARAYKGKRAVTAANPSILRKTKGASSSKARAPDRPSVSTCLRPPVSPSPPSVPTSSPALPSFCPFRPPPGRPLRVRRFRRPVGLVGPSLARLSVRPSCVARRLSSPVRRALGSAVRWFVSGSYGRSGKPSLVICYGHVTSPFAFSSFLLKSLVLASGPGDGRTEGGGGES